MRTAKLLLLLLLLTLAVAALFPLLSDDRPPARGELRGLPWQIDVLEDGRSRVFDITLGVTTLGEARSRHGDQMELAIIAGQGETGALEGYYSDFTAGVLSGKLILVGQIDGPALQALREGAAKVEYTDSGARKYVLSATGLERAYRAPISVVTFIPAVNLDETVAVQRFGEPDRRVQAADGATHLLYPGLGLDLILNEDGREILQYVAPRDFARLRAPLEGGGRDAD